MAGLSIKLEAYEKQNKMYGQPEYEMFLNDPGCTFGSDQNGNYKIDFKLDKCGTTVVQENGQLGNFSGLSSKDRPLFDPKMTSNDHRLTLFFSFHKQSEPKYCWSDR